MSVDSYPKSISTYLPFAWAAAITLVLGWCFRNWGYDDPYITYRYAENLANGTGFVYNASERVLSTTTPFYTLVLALAHLIGLDIPVTSLALGCLSLALGGLALWQFGQLWNNRVAGAAGLVLYPVFPLLLPTLGAETTLYIALILWGLLAYSTEHYTWAAVLLGCAALTRADGVLAALVAGGHWLVIRRAHVPWRAIIVYTILLIAWFGFAWLYFGAPLPVTLLAKQQQGRMAISAGHSFFDGLSLRLRGYWATPLYRNYLLLGSVGLATMVVRQREWLVVVGWVFVYIAAYTALGVTNYFWYYGPLAAGLVALAALGITAIVNVARRFNHPRVGVGLAALLIALLLWPLGSALINMSGTTDKRMGVYQTTGTWLREHTPPDAVIGTLEVGVIGYYAKRRMIDFAGLIQPRTAQLFTTQTTYEASAVQAMKHYKPSYLVASHDFFEHMAEQESALRKQCRRVEMFSDARFQDPLVVYACSY